MASTYLDDVARRGADDGRVAREAEDRPEKEGKHRAREHLEPGPYFTGGPDGLVRYCYFIPKHWRMASAAHGLPKVLLGPAMPNPSTPCGRTPLKPLTAVSVVAVRTDGVLRPSCTSMVTPNRMPLFQRTHAIRP
jgi:hypothetical protein